jgi:uroporphyrinogen decarboxylase
VVCCDQLLELFDSWSGDLCPADFEAFELPFLVQIATRVKATLKAEGREVVPITVFPKGTYTSTNQPTAFRPSAL